MNKLIFSLLTIVFAFNYASAQARIVSNASFDKVKMDAYEIQMNLAPDQVIDLWDEFWDDTYDVDVDREDRNRKRQIYMAKEVKVDAISDKQIDVYSSITTTDDNWAVVSLGFGVGYEVYASQKDFGPTFASAERVLNEFAAYSYQKVYGERVEEQEKLLKDLREDKEDLESDITKREEDIERSQEKIKELENDIEKARRENEEARQSIEEVTSKIINQKQVLLEAQQKLTKWN